HPPKALTGKQNSGYDQPTIVQPFLVAGFSRIVQCKMSMKPELIPMQHEHETGCGEMGMLRPDASEDAECRTFKPRTNPGVSGIERRNRVRRARADADLRLDRTRSGSARVRPTQQEGARVNSRLHRENDGAEPGADHTVNPNVSGHREGAGGDLSAAPVRSPLHRCRHRASGRRGSRARTSERIGNAADSGARV